MVTAKTPAKAADPVKTVPAGFVSVGGGNVKYFKYPECKKGQVLVEAGIYKGPSQGKYGVIHTFILDDGSVTVLNSSALLNWILEHRVTVGARCRVIYGGKLTMTKGAGAGKDAHQFEVLVDGTQVDAKGATSAAHVPSAVVDLDISL